MITGSSEPSAHSYTQNRAEMSNKKGTSSRPHDPGTSASTQKRQVNFASARLDWRRVGDYLSLSCSEIMGEFAAREGITPSLFLPSRLKSRSKSDIESILHPWGWRHLCLTQSYTGGLKRKGWWNRERLRAACVEGRVPYWKKMTGNEMRAVLLGWAIAEDVPEFK